MAKWKQCQIHAWHIEDEHVHLYISIPPKYSVFSSIQILKGKTSSWLKKKQRNFPRMHSEAGATMSQLSD
ncbi:MAG TPA: hypothetical protein ENN31_01675 [Candidatus Vogelbacteria bacterium]|nr:hypothetical protein [Candidatus Vogelbacteria bacterium]